MLPHRTCGAGWYWRFVCGGMSRFFRPRQHVCLDCSDLRSGEQIFERRHAPGLARAADDDGVELLMDLLRCVAKIRNAAAGHSVNSVAGAAEVCVQEFTLADCCRRCIHFYRRCRWLFVAERWNFEQSSSAGREGEDATEASLAGSQ